MNLQIQCPACSRRFQIHEDLTGKTVECGACDHRFSVDPESIVVEKRKIYPGEHDQSLLQGFGATPVREDAPVAFQTAAYADGNAAAVMPATAGQTIASLVGAAMIIFYTVIFVLGTGEGMAFQDVGMSKRLLLGAFVAVLGSGLIIFGAKNWRLRGILISLGLSALLFTMIFIRPVHMTPKMSGAGRVTQLEEEEEVVVARGEPEMEEDRYLDYIGYDAVEKWMASAGEDAPEGEMVVVYMRPVKDSHMIDIKSSFQTQLRIASTSPVFSYKRDEDRARLMILTGVQGTFDEAVALAEKWGRAKSMPEKNLIDLVVSSAHFARPSDEDRKKLTDPNHSLFCAANLQELKHLNIERVKDAVDRIDVLPEGTTLRLKPEISARLLELLETQTDPDLLSGIGQALKTWVGNDPGVSKKVGARALEWVQEGIDVPRSVVDYLSATQAAEAAAIVDAMWVKDQTAWNSAYQDLGAAGEDRLLFHVRNSPADVKRGAVDVLWRVGTAKSLSVLQGLRGNADQEFDIQLLRAIDAIKKR